LLGNGIIKCHGKLLGAAHDAVDGRALTPALPWVATCDEALISFYEERFRPMARVAASMATELAFSQVFWIAAPDMCDSVARARFAPEYVDQGCHRFHRQAARCAMLRLLAPVSERITVLEHPESLCNPLTGFSRDAFRCNDGPYDIHVSADYYRPAIAALLSRLPA